MELNGRAWMLGQTVRRAIWISTVDMLGRQVRTERPAFDSGSVVSRQFYNNLGQLVRSQQPGIADTFYEYEANDDHHLGELKRTVLDVNTNGMINLGADDRIAESETAYVNTNGRMVASHRRQDLPSQQ